MLSEKSQSDKKHMKQWTTKKSTASRVCEIFEYAEKDESGQIPVIVSKEEIVNKKK